MSTVTETCFEWTATGPSLASPSERCQLNFFMENRGRVIGGYYPFNVGVQLK